MVITKNILLASLALASAADVPISVKMYASNDCSGTPIVAASAAEALTDAETISGTSHPTGMCISDLGGGASFMGSCPSLDTTTMQQWDGSSFTQQGMRYCWMANGDCTGTCSSSAAFSVVAAWTPPTCQSHTAIFGSSSEYGINSVQLSCGDSVNPSPPPPAAPAPCFPSSAIVTMADGTPSRIDALKEGDEILAATDDGTLTTDTVSLLSIAMPEVKGAAYVALTTAANKTLTLTPGHHVPVGAACCSTLKEAKDIKIGDKMWAVKDGAAKATAVFVAKISSVKATGLHSPVLTNGGFPIVDNVVTSFDSIDKVTLAKHGLAPLLKACKATGIHLPCETFRDMFLSADDRHYIA